MEPALVYLQKVKTRYANDPERYRRFLELLSPGDSPGALNDVSASFPPSVLDPLSHSIRFYVLWLHRMTSYCLFVKSLGTTLTL